MIIEDKITVKNYKCFDSDGAGFERIMPINIIIGKNNSGKSSLIDLIQFVIQPQSNFLNYGRGNSQSEVLIAHKLTEQEISTTFKSNTSGGGIPGNNHFEYGKDFAGRQYTYSLKENQQKTYKEIDAPFIDYAKDKIEGLANAVQNTFAKKLFCHITAERDIVPDVANATIKFSSNGQGATNTIQEIINRTNRNSNLVERELLNEINKIANPDIEFTRILVQLNDDSRWELFFENSANNRIALSKMGSGIKTVLLVLLNLIVRPSIENKSRDSYVFAFEELENNLHPSLQRRLYNYIKEYSEKHSAHFFLTTHSNIVIDAFGTYKNAQLIHVINDGVKSTTKTLLSQNGTKQILNDLGVKASDILQSNGVIWVEGPSDRNYLNRWLEIAAPELKEGLHYSIMFYGGRLLSNLSFDFEWFTKEVIPLLKINQNAFVIIDRDGTRISAQLNTTKMRISEEIGSDNSWITKGREIENYLSGKTIEEWLLNKHGYKSEIVNDKNTKLEDNIINSSKKIKLKYNLSKTVYSAEITTFINSKSLNILDLKERLNNLVAKIKEWNE